MGKLSRAQLIAALNLIAGYAKHADSAAAAGTPSSAPSLRSPPTAQATEMDSSTAPISIPCSSSRASEACGDSLSDCAGSDVDQNLEDDLVSGIVDGLLEGDDWISYSRFISICTEEETVMSWLEKLAKGCGELIEESVESLERHMVELEMVRSKVVQASDSSGAGIGSPPQPFQQRQSSPSSSGGAIKAYRNSGSLADFREASGVQQDKLSVKAHNIGRSSFVVRRSASAAHDKSVDTAPFVIDYDAV